MYKTHLRVFYFLNKMKKKLKSNHFSLFLFKDKIKWPEDYTDHFRATETCHLGSEVNLSKLESSTSLNLSINSLPGICLHSFILLFFGQEFILRIQSCKQGLRITIEASILQDSRSSFYYIVNTNMITVTKRGLAPNKEKPESWHWWNWRRWDSRKEVWSRQLFSSIRFDVRGVKPHWFALFRVAGPFVEF